MFQTFGFDIKVCLVEATRTGQYLAQRISIAIQQGNVASVLRTLPTGVHIDQLKVAQRAICRLLQKVDWLQQSADSSMAALINVVAGYNPTYIECGPYGFICERNNRVRLCEGENLFGPAFLCPTNTVCSEESSDVCLNIANFIDSSFTRTIRCHRNERIADPNVPDCKGYILCIPNKNRFQGIKFKCSGNTVFNGYTRTCSAPDRYTCPVPTSTKQPELYDNNRKTGVQITSNDVRRTIDCKNYKFSVTQGQSPGKATYFCPSRPVAGGTSVICTIFSNQFCVTLERDSEDQFIQDNAPARRPRM